MKQIMKILEPFKELTNKLQADKHPTISLVYPGIISLRDALQYRTFVPAEQEVIHSPLAKKQKAQSLFTFDTGPRNRTSSQEELHRMSIADQYKKFCNLVRNEQEKTSKFWERNKEDFLELGILAERLLSIPATSGAVERLFSYLTMHTAGRKGNTKSRLVSQKILCSYNEKYL
ncbi:hypothetical protein DdX_02785 [Ditylenchus destructor]|uniref:HAT C-terminal dimerisation domain-containing protein n=1 Tax=Ditylenchus destructor TaxID=166010 RepID=A0AAD4R9F7_9BILA|nr:hypothetical protein DdX_02785 [Ditylenchus destructor]